MSTPWIFDPASGRITTSNSQGLNPIEFQNSGKYKTIRPNPFTVRTSSTSRVIDNLQSQPEPEPAYHDRLGWYGHSWAQKDKKMGKFDWSTHATEAWPTSHLELPARIGEINEDDPPKTKIHHALIDKYAGNDLNKVSFPINEACEKYFEDSVFSELRKQFPDLDEQVKKAENEIELFKKHNTYTNPQSGISLECLDDQGRAIVFLTEEFEIVDSAYNTKRAIMVKHQIALSSRVTRMEDTLLKCFEEDDLATDKIHFVLRLAYARMAKRKEFYVSRLLSIDLKPSTITPRNGKEFIDLVKQYCATLNDCAHPAAEILTDVFRKAEESSGSRQQRKTFAELSRSAMMAHGMFGAYFFMEVMELWEYILIPTNHELFTFDKDYLKNYLSRFGQAPSKKKKKNSNNKKKKKKKAVAEVLPTESNPPADRNAPSQKELEKSKKAYEALQCLEEPVHLFTSFVNQAKGLLGGNDGEKEVKATEVLSIAAVSAPEFDVIKTKQETLNELLAMENTKAEKPQAPQKKKKKTTRAVRNDKKPKVTETSRPDASDSCVRDGKQDEKNPATISEASTLSLDEEGFGENGWETVKSKRIAKEAAPSRRTRFDNARERQIPMPVNDKPISGETQNKTVTTPSDRTRLSFEQTKYRQALLKPVVPKPALAKETVGSASTASETSATGKRLVEARASVPKPKPEVMLPKDVDDLSEFPALAVKKDTTSGKSAGTLRIVSQPQRAVPISRAATSQEPPAERSITDLRQAPNALKKLQQADLTKSAGSIIKAPASASNTKVGSSEDKPQQPTKIEPISVSAGKPVTTTASVKKSTSAQSKKRDIPVTTEKKKNAPQQARSEVRQPVKPPSSLSTPRPIPTTVKALSEVREVIEKEQPKPTDINPKNTLTVKVEKKIENLKQNEEPTTVAKSDKAHDAATLPGSQITKAAQKEPKQSEKKLVQTQKPVEPVEVSSTARSTKLEKGTSVTASDNVTQPKKDQAQKEEMSVPKEADAAVSVNQADANPKSMLASKATPAQEVAIPTQAPIRFGCLIVEPSGTNIVNSPRSVRWGDSEIDSEEEQTETKIDARAQTNSKLSQELVADTVVNASANLDDDSLKFLQKYYAAPLSHSNTTAKPGPITPIKGSFHSRGTSTSSWPIGVDEPAITANKSEVIPQPVDIQITVSEPPTASNVQPSEPNFAVTGQGETMDAQRVQALDGTSDGTKLPEARPGARKMSVKDNNTLQLPEAVLTMPAVSVIHGNGTHGVFPEVVNGAPSQQYVSNTTDPELAPICLRSHIFICPNCEKQIRHRSSIVCPGCGPDADVRFCSSACLFGNHQHWKHCGTLAFNRPIVDGILMQYEAMPVSKTQWTSFELWRQALHIWDDENIDYFIFNTESNELVGKVIFNRGEYERFRFRQLRDQCIMYQDNEDVGLLFRALWHQCEFQDVPIKKIELRHLLALEYGQDVPSVYIPRISDYEWACAGYVLSGYEPHPYALQRTGYYHGHGYLPQFG